MPISKENIIPVVKWVGYESDVNVPQLSHKSVIFYKKCIWENQIIQVDDYVLVLNADSSLSQTASVAGCDVAKILHLYEIQDSDEPNPYRAIVQWYSRPKSIPAKHFDSDDICIELEVEVIEEHRPYDTDISLEAIYKKCYVTFGGIHESATEILKAKARFRRNPMFVCRYKFVRVTSKTYRLVPIHDDTKLARTRNSTKAATPKTKEQPKPKSSSTRKTKAVETTKKRRASVASVTSMASDLNYHENENKVSPIKIIGGCNVVRLSAKKRSYSSNNISQINEMRSIQSSPLTEQNVRITPRSRAAAARRNLNLCLDDNSQANTTAESDCLNYSIVKPIMDSEPTSDMRIKLRVSERSSAKLVSVEEDPLSIVGYHNDMNLPDGFMQEHYYSPSKKTKKATEVEETVGTPKPLRRKSILKSASTRLDGTPKRSIQLSNVVEKRIFNDDEIISTPKRASRTVKSIRNLSEVDNEQITPKKSAQKTPTRRLKLLRSGELSPSLKQRENLSKGDSRKSDLQLAREYLHVSVVPKSLPCREKEYENIYNFLLGKIEDECGGCMYVSGVPGTGKTATVTNVVRMLQQQAANGDIPKFQYLEINGMRLTEPRQAYVSIYKQLTGKTVSWEHALSLLEKRFTTPAPCRLTTVLVVDELDILCNRRQDVVYNLLDWPTKSAAHLVVVTLANTMDLPERLLMGKVTSRLGLTRLTFQPYTFKQLQEIVTSRLGGTDAFKSEAIQLVARKVAAVSGDARRALDICRRSTEIADISTNHKDANTQHATAASTPYTAGAAEKSVNLNHVQQALAEMIASAKVQAIKNCSLFEKIFLQAVAAEISRTGVEETSFMGVYTQMESIAAFNGVATPKSGLALQICSKLSAQRLLICEHSRNDIFQKILLNISVDDIHYALRVSDVEKA